MLIKEPEFKKPPISDAADVPENIDLWLDTKPGDRYYEQHKRKAELFLRPDPKGHRGHRFVQATDFTEIIETEQRLCGLDFTVVFVRRFHTPDRLCPLYFAPWYARDEVYLLYKEHWFRYESDAHIRRFCKKVKEERL